MSAYITNVELETSQGTPVFDRSGLAGIASGPAEVRLDIVLDGPIDHEALGGYGYDSRRTFDYLASQAVGDLKQDEEQVRRLLDRANPKQLERYAVLLDAAMQGGSS